MALSITLKPGDSFSAGGHTVTLHKIHSPTRCILQTREVLSQVEDRNWVTVAPGIEVRTSYGRTRAAGMMRLQINAIGMKITRGSYGKK